MTGQVVNEIGEEPKKCLQLKREVFIKFLEILGEKLENNPTFRNGEDVIKFSKEVAEAFDEKNGKLGSIFEERPKDCTKFFDIFSEEQLAKLREFAKKAPIKVELKSLKKSLGEYMEQNFRLFKERLKAEDFTEEEIERAWKARLDYFIGLINENTEYKTRIASVRIKESTEKINESDPYFLTYLLIFEPEGKLRSEKYETLKEKIFEGDVASVEETLKKLVRERWSDEEEDEIDSEFPNYLNADRADFDDKWEENREKILPVVFDLFDAIDSLVRVRFELEHFKDLIEFARERFEEENLKKTAERVVQNLKLLEEIFEENPELAKFLIEAIPVGFEFLDKITDYKAEKDFRYFLYTYKAKINEIAEGAVENHLNVRGLKTKPSKGVDSKTRSGYFLKQGELFSLIVEHLEKLEDLDKEANEDLYDLMKKLPSYLKGFIKAYFFYGTPKKEIIEELYTEYEKVKIAVQNWFNENKLTEGDKQTLKRVSEKIRKIFNELTGTKTKTYKQFEELYKSIAENLLKDFIKKRLPLSGKEIYVAVDFESLADEIENILTGEDKTTKTKLYRGILKVLTSKEELENYEYILRIKNAIYNHPLDLDREIEPEVGALRPIKDLDGFFNLTAELSKERFPNRQLFKIGFVLSFLILTSIIASRSRGMVIGFSLPHSSNPKEDYRLDKNERIILYTLTGSSVFVKNSSKIAVAQSFNWKNIPEKLIKKKDEKTKKEKKLDTVLRFYFNKTYSINDKIKNGLTSLYANLPFEIEGLSLKRKVAVLALSNPVIVDKTIRALLGEGYIFEPLTRQKDLFSTAKGVKVYRQTFAGWYDFIEGDLKSVLKGYRETFGDFIKELKEQGVEEVYLVPPLPLYRGLATKEEFLKELYFSDMLSEIYSELPFKLLFSGFGVVYTPQLTNFKKRIFNFLKKKGVKIPMKQGKKKKDKETNEDTYDRLTFAVNLFKNVEKITPRSGAFPLVIPIFAIIPLFSMEEGKKDSEKKTLFHHAFIYSVPNHQLFKGQNIEMIYLNRNEKKELADLLSVIHLIQYQKNEEIKKNTNKIEERQKTFKRNPFYVFPERRSNDKNIFALTELELFFGRENRPRWQTVLTDFEIWGAVRDL